MSKEFSLGEFVLHAKLYHQQIGLDHLFDTERPVIIRGNGLRCVVRLNSLRGQLITQDQFGLVLCEPRQYRSASMLNSCRPRQSSEKILRFY